MLQYPLLRVKRLFPTIKKIEGGGALNVGEEVGTARRTLLVMVVCCYG